MNATDTIRNFSGRPDVVRKSAALLERGLKHMRDVARATLEQNRLYRRDNPLSPTDFEDIRLLIEPELGRMAQVPDWQVPGDVVAGRAPAGRPCPADRAQPASERERRGGAGRARWSVRDARRWTGW